jgi:predicted DNA-binding helix-hairpin-helix protein
MTAIISKPDTEQKLDILSRDGQYDLACACGTSEDDHRQRGADGRWIYPVTLPNGGKSVLFKTLVSNVCNNDCKYCPLREQVDVRRCSLGVEETVKVFLDYYNQKKVFGLFLSSGVIGTADATMDRLNTISRLLRNKYKFMGYIHLKVIPGASNAAIKEAVSLASAVSVNIETPGEENLAKLSDKKQYMSDIIAPLKLISRLTRRGSRYARVKQTTQFIVGAAGETDKDIVRYTWGLYDRLKLNRVYFSAYQKGLGDEDLPGEKQLHPPADTFTREHRLYQVDFLFRKYGFKGSDIVFDVAGGLSPESDPKEVWANSHPEAFPVNVNYADKFELLRVPGLGPVTVNRIIERRRFGRLQVLSDIGKVGLLLQKASRYLVF